MVLPVGKEYEGAVVTTFRPSKQASATTELNYTVKGQNPTHIVLYSTVVMYSRVL